MKINKKTLIKVLDISIIMLAIILIVLATPLLFAESENPKTMTEISENCINMSLMDSSDCVVGQTKGFYKYNMDNVGKQMSFTELRDEGGVCSSWSDYYTQLGENLGYNTENVIVPVSGNIYHEFSVWTSGEGYCILDQNEYSCFEFQTFSVEDF